MSGRWTGLAAMARLVARGVRAEPGTIPVAAGGPRRRPAAERTGITTDPRLVARYLAATGGEGITAFRGPGAVLPPLFPATWQTALALELLAELDPPLAVTGVVHLEDETNTLRCLRADESFRCRVELERADPARGGVRLELAARNWTMAGILCAQSRLTFLVRTRGPSSGTRERRPPDSNEEPAVWETLDRWRLDGSAGRRYARASGDYNPIHLWRLTARPFGFARPILHGYATEARVAHTILKHRLGGDPHALRRLCIAFRAPLALPATVRLEAAADGEPHRFRVVSDVDERVFADGDFSGGR